MAEEREPLLGPEGLKNWREFYEDFQTELMPVASEHGLSLGEALIVFRLNELTNILAELRDMLTEARGG